jgi:hypothetical protein
MSSVAVSVFHVDVELKPCGEKNVAPELASNVHPTRGNMTEMNLFAGIAVEVVKNIVARPLEPGECTESFSWTLRSENEI